MPLLGLNAFRESALPAARTKSLFDSFWKKFESDEAAKLRVLGLVDHTHTTATKLLDDAVVRNSLAGELGGSNHWRECYVQQKIKSMKTEKMASLEQMAGVTSPLHSKLLQLLRQRIRATKPQGPGSLSPATLSKKYSCRRFVRLRKGLPPSPCDHPELPQLLWNPSSRQHSRDLSSVCLPESET